MSTFPQSSDSLANHNVTPVDHVVTTQSANQPGKIQYLNADGTEFVEPVLTPDEQVGTLLDARNTLLNSSSVGQPGSIVRAAVSKIDHVLANMTGKMKGKPYQSAPATQAAGTSVPQPVVQPVKPVPASV